jgi:hypothetical protein
MVVVWSATPTAAQSKEFQNDNIANLRVSIEINDGSLGDVVDGLITNYNVVVGFEESILDRDHNDYDFLTTLSTNESALLRSNGSVAALVSFKQVFTAKVHKLTVNFENEKLSTVLDSIVSQMGNYKWEINDGVVNIIPTKGRDKKFEDLLSLEIKSFYLGENASLARIRHQIKILPEVKKFVDENGLKTSGFRTGGIYGASQRPVGYELKFSNLTLRQLLNKIAKTKGGGWILKKQDISPKDGDPRMEIEFDI